MQRSPLFRVHFVTGSEWTGDIRGSLAYGNWMPRPTINEAIPPLAASIEELFVLVNGNTIALIFTPLKKKLYIYIYYLENKCEDIFLEN